MAKKYISILKNDRNRYKKPGKNIYYKKEKMIYS